MLATRALFNRKSVVVDVQIGDMGLNKDRKPTDHYQPKINLYAKQTLIAEGSRGLLTEELIRHFNLRRNSNF